MAGITADDFDGSGVSPSQAVSLVGAPTFPNCLKFSETNLLAVASGHLVTILDPAALSGPRGFIPVTGSSLFDVGTVPQEALQAGPLLPYVLSRDPRPGVRSMDWSPSGLAQNGGCLLAVCTTDNRVKVYREPFSDFQSDWAEVIDVSEMAYNHCRENDFRESEVVAAQIAMQDDSLPPTSGWVLPGKRKYVEEHEDIDEPQHRKMQKKNYVIMTKSLGGKDMIQTAAEHQEFSSDNSAQPEDTNRSSCEEASTRTPPNRREESSLELATAPESATSAMLEENAVVHPPASGSVSDTSKREAFLMLGDHAAANSYNRGQETVNAGDATVSVVDDGANENLAAVVTKSRMSMKVFARRHAASGRRLAMTSSCLPATNPDTDTCLVVNTSARPVRMRKVSSRFRDRAELLQEETISESSLVVRSKNVGRDKRVVFEDQNAIICVNKGTEKHPIEDVDAVEPVVDHVSTREVVSEVSKLLPPSLKHARRLKSRLDGKIRIAADYVARTELLSPLAIAWSPKCQAAERVDMNKVKVNKPISFALLGGGTKSGRVSIWRMMYPPCYSTDYVHTPVEASFLGFLDAHQSWVTCLCWASCDFDLLKVSMVAPNTFVTVSTEKLLLVTGCADGSVKFWAARSDLLINASSNQSLPIAFCKQVDKADSVPVTSLAIVVLSQPSDRALLAVGKGSGSLAIYEIRPSGACHQICFEEGAHQQTVTGLSWRFDGLYLYSCAQDSLKTWELLKTELKPVKLPDWSAVFPIINSPDLCSSDAMESFFGVALSRNCMALVTVRDLDSDALDQMYQARTQRAVVQMFWLGMRPTHVKKDASFIDVPKVMTGNEIAGWQMNIVSALKHLEDSKEPLVLWDVMAAMSLLKEAVGGEVIVIILSEWLMGWNRGEDAVGAVESTERPAIHFENAVSEASCRQLHILNVIYRRVLLVHLKPEVINTCASRNVSLMQTGNAVTRDEKLWRKCIYIVEHELRQRLIHFRLCIAVHKEEGLENDKDSLSNILLNAKWVLEHSTSVSSELWKVASQLRKSHRQRFRSSLEICPICESPLVLDSPETASCQGTVAGTEVNSHHLRRCSVSMQVCPPAAQWYCSCCQRRAIEQAPSLFFGLPSRSRISEVAAHASVGSDTYPGCPFCGVLMHRMLPNFLLTPTLV